MATGGAHLFLLGLASGLTLLAISAYRHASPAWLKWLLIISGILLISRYVVSAQATTTSNKESLQLWIVQYCWISRFIGLTLPAIFAVDQIIRHPAMTPQKLLQWYAPFLIAAGVALALGNVALVVVQIVFFIGLVGVCLMLMRKIPSPPIQRALLGLALAYGCLGVDALAVILDRYRTLFFSSEMVALLALWYAYETSAVLQRSS